MQLILETPSTLDIQGDMSTIEEPLNEKVMVNGDVEILNDKNCNGNKENLVDSNIITAGEVCTKVNNVQIIDNLLSQTLDNDEDVLLNGSDKGLEKSETENPNENGAPNADIDAPIRELLDNSPNKDVNIKKSPMNHDSEEVDEELIEDDIISIKYINSDVPEILDTTKTDTEKEDESLVGKEDNINCISANVASVIANIDHTLELSHKDGDCINVNVSQACNALTKDTEEANKEKKQTDVEGLNNIDKETPKEICEIPIFSDDVEESEPIELNDVMVVDEVLVKSKNSICDVTDLNKDQVKSKPIEMPEQTNEEELTDVVKKETSDTSNVTNINKEVISAAINLQDKVDVEGSKGIVQEVKSEISHSIQNTQTNKVTQQSVPNELRDEISFVPKEMKSDTYCKFKFPTLDKSVEKSSIEVQDEMDLREIKDIEENKVESKDVITSQTRAANPVTIVKSVEKSATEVQDEMDVEEIKDIQEHKDETNDVITSYTRAASPVTLDESVDKSAIEVQDEMDVEEIKDIQENKGEIKDVATSQTLAASPVNNVLAKPPICKLSNTLDILSDDDDEPPSNKSQDKEVEPQTKAKEIGCTQQQSINIEDDDDIMLIDEDLPTETEVNKHVEKENNDKVQASIKTDSHTHIETGENCNKESDNLFSNSNEKESIMPAVSTIDSSVDIDIKEKTTDKESKNLELQKPLLPENFLLSAKKNLADMTREDLEEFCILKIVESIVDRSSLSDIKAKLKAMAQSIEEYRKKAMMLTKQNRDLQVVLKSVQEEQKKMTDLPINPLKITRSVGMQVLMTDKLTARRKAMLGQVPTVANNNTNRQNVRPTGPSPRMLKTTTSNQIIPVPRLVPANTPALKSPSTVSTNVQTNTPGKTGPSSVPNGMKALTPAQKSAEKRQHNRIQSVTVDLTDDEPPAKMNPRSSPAPPVRLVPPQNLMAPQRQPFIPAAVNSPRKVYIPISGPQNQSIRPGQTIMLKPMAGTRPRCAPPQPPRMQNPLRRVTSGRHPAPLPDATKQCQPPNWKALPPAPDLRLSKVENGIVISWKIEGYQEDSYEEIASYQLYAYQETSAPPSTTLWKKIGDVKALPLPMACTLTQFMAGFKYYFAVRAVDVKSRFGPFSLPGSILLLNKL